MAGRWKPGESGNPKGRPAGSRHKATIVAKTLMDGQAKALVQKIIEKALEGDTMCLRVCIERLVPPCKEGPLSVKLPAIKSVKDLPDLLARIMALLEVGELTIGEAQGLSAVAESCRKVLEISEFQAQLEQIREELNEISKRPK